jgi:hypothetical protein
MGAGHLPLAVLFSRGGKNVCATAILTTYHYDYYSHYYLVFSFLATADLKFCCEGGLLLVGGQAFYFLLLQSLNHVNEHFF